MEDETPSEAEELDTAQKIAVNGSVVGEIKIKPDALLSDIEDEVFAVVLAAQFGGVAQDGEKETELLKEYDPEVQIWADNEDEDEPSWSPSVKISETEFLDVYENL
jgi:hypothetical protein